MCNLYNMTEKGELERYISSLGRPYYLPEYQVQKPVGPFGTGVFLRPGEEQLVGHVGQWALIRPGQLERVDWIEDKPEPGKKPKAKRAKSTNNARIERLDGRERPTTATKAWKEGRRCLVPSSWYREPNWETGRNVWWHLRRADGLPWLIAGLYNLDWVDQQSAEIVDSYTMITVNCDSHPMLNRLHRPVRDPKTKEILPMSQQDKRSLVHIEPANWDTWLRGPADEAYQLLTPPPAEVFDQSDAQQTDELLALQERQAAEPQEQQNLL